jgi:hypothetical protein
MPLPLVFIFQFVFFDEVGKFINSMVIWSGKSALKLVRRIGFLII